MRCPVVAQETLGAYARGEATSDSDVDCLVLLKRVDRADDRAITDLADDLAWQIGGVVISPLMMSAADFEDWKALERRTPLEIERERIPLWPRPTGVPMLRRNSPASTSPCGQPACSPTRGSRTTPEAVSIEQYTTPPMRCS